MIPHALAALTFLGTLAYGLVGLRTTPRHYFCAMTQIQIIQEIVLYRCEGSCNFPGDPTNNRCDWQSVDNGGVPEARCQCYNPYGNPLPGQTAVWCEARLIHPTEGASRLGSAAYCMPVGCPSPCVTNAPSPYNEDVCTCPGKSL